LLVRIVVIGRYILGGFEKRVAEQYIQAYDHMQASPPVASPVPFSGLDEGGAFPRAGGPSAADRRVDEEELLKMSIGPNWLPPLGERRVPLWDETRGRVVIGESAPMVRGCCSLEMIPFVQLY